jgi:hypothetical protein
VTEASAAPDPAARARPSWQSGVAAASAAAISRPGAWPVALVGLLVRGSIVAFVMPIVVLPTMTGLATVLSPAIISIALGQPDAAVARLIAVVVGSFLAWLVASVILGAATDVVLIRWMAADIEGGPAVPDGRAIVVLRVALARAAAHLPLLVVAGWGLTRLVEVTRQELIMPGDLAVPIVLRVVLGAPEVFALLLVTWLGGEALGELAARGVVLQDRTATRSLVRALGQAIRGAPGTIATVLVGTIGLVLLVAPAVVAASATWGGLRVLLLGDSPVVASVVGALVLSLAWIAGLALAGLAATWRSALWTAEVMRTRSPRTAGDPSADGSALPTSRDR